MSNRKSAAELRGAGDDPFAAFFEGVEQSASHRLGLAKLEFTEEIVNRMHALRLKKGELARRLGVQPGFVTRLLSGRNNFELGTMVKVSMALDCEFRCHLQAAGTETMWMDFLKEEPARPAADWQSTKYQRVSSETQLSITDESLAAAA
jgi:plasmid maintenance system antidote protein VapI